MKTWIHPGLYQQLRLVWHGMEHIVLAHYGPLSKNWALASECILYCIGKYVCLPYKLHSWEARIDTVYDLLINSTRVTIIWDCWILGVYLWKLLVMSLDCTFASNVFEGVCGWVCVCVSHVHAVLDDVDWCIFPNHHAMNQLWKGCFAP